VLDGAASTKEARLQLMVCYRAVMVDRSFIDLRVELIRAYATAWRGGEQEAGDGVAEMERRFLLHLGSGGHPDGLPDNPGDASFWWLFWDFCRHSMIGEARRFPHSLWIRDARNRAFSK
jgi:hypothetical protein